jgi:hypothetical protein
MTDPATGHTAHGSTAHRGPHDRPLAEQPTEVVPLDRHELPDEESYRPAYARRRSAPYDDDPYDDDAHDDDPHDDDPDDDGGAQDWAPEYSTAPIAVRRADVLAGLLLLLAGMAAGVSLLVVWLNGGPTGLDLVRDGIEDARGGVATLAGTGSWPPLAVVGGGVVLFVLGLLMYVPAKTHRFLGALALLVALVVAAGVLVPLAEVDWELSRWAVGGWFTAAVGGLGLLGAFKALSTGTRTPR